MKIYIELLVLVGIALTALVWSVWFNYSQNKLRRKYDGQRSRQTERRNPFSAENSSSFTGFTQPEGRSTVQTTGFDAERENSSSTRNSSNFFSRRFKKRG